MNGWMFDSFITTPKTNGLWWQEMKTFDMRLTFHCPSSPVTILHDTRTICVQIIAEMHIFAKPNLYGSANLGHKRIEEATISPLLKPAIHLQMDHILWSLGDMYKHLSGRERRGIPLANASSNTVMEDLGTCTLPKRFGPRRRKNLWPMEKYF